MLSATSWDPVAERLVRDAAELRVHSLFERALNLVTPSGELVGLVGPRAGNGPATIVLAELSGLGLDRRGLRPNDLVRARPGRLSIGGRLEVDLGVVRRWEPWPTRVAVAPDELRARLARAEHIACVEAPDGGLAPLLPHLAVLASDDDASMPAGLDPLGRAAWTALRALLPPWARGDAVAVGEAATKLVGLGPGLTPSGDDLLAGLLVGTTRARGAVPTALGRACLAAARGRTTDIALARIGHAARGAIEEVQEAVIAQVGGTGDGEGGMEDVRPPTSAAPSAARDGDRALEVAVARATRWGHTSGVDTLVGLFLALRTSS